MVTRFASKENLKNLRSTVIILNNWKSKLGTDEQFLLKNLSVELYTFNKDSDYIFRLDTQLYRLYDDARNRAFVKLAQKDPKAGAKAKATSRDQYDAAYNRPVYEARKLRAEVGALRNEVAELRDQVNA